MYQMYKKIFLETWFKPLVILIIIIIINIILCNNHVIQFFSCEAIINLIST